MVLLIGASGYVGQAFADELRRRGIAFVSVTRATLDYTRFDRLFTFVRSRKPEFILNAAGYTGRPTIESCESARTVTVQANTLLPQTIARVAYLTKTPWGHVSSGDIFSGVKVRSNGSFRLERDLVRADLRDLFANRPNEFRGFSEVDEPNFSFRAQPCSFYSGTKALAEEGLHWFSQGYIWRPGPMFDGTDHPRNLLRYVCGCPTAEFAFGSLSHRGDFVRACLELWERRASFGTYHIANSGVVTGEQILRHAKNNVGGSHRKVSGSVAYSHPPVHCMLDTTKLRRAGIEVRSVKDALGESEIRGN